MAFKSFKAPPGVDHGVKGSGGTMEAVYPLTSNHDEGEDTEFAGGGWGGWNGGSVTIGIGIMRREKE